MSADNYWFIAPHPNGGFTYRMGFASDPLPPVITEDLPRFPTVLTAHAAAAADDWTEYGFSYHPALRMTDSVQLPVQEIVELDSAVFWHFESASGGDDTTLFMVLDAALKVIAAHRLITGGEPVCLRDDRPEDAQ